MMMIKIGPRNLDLFGQESASAVLSPCRRYRYALTRSWAPGDRVCWVMLNPSTADAEQDDATIRKITAYSKKWGLGGLVVVNLFGWRATDPRELPADAAVAIGPDNDMHIEREVKGSAMVVCGWGNHGSKHDRGRAVLAKIIECGRTPLALKLNRNGNPAHPLYLAGSLHPSELA